MRIARILRALTAYARIVFTITRKKELGLVCTQELLQFIHVGSIPTAMF